MRLAERAKLSPLQRSGKVSHFERWIVPSALIMDYDSTIRGKSVEYLKSTELWLRIWQMYTLYKCHQMSSTVQVAELQKHTKNANMVSPSWQDLLQTAPGSTVWYFYHLDSKWHPSMSLGTWQFQYRVSTIFQWTVCRHSICFAERQLEKGNMPRTSTLCTNKYV